MDEYDKLRTLTDGTRRRLVNLVVANMVEIHGMITPVSVRTNMLWASSQCFPASEIRTQTMDLSTSMTNRVDLATWPGE